MIAANELLAPVAPLDRGPVNGNGRHGHALEPVLSAETTTLKRSVMRDLLKLTVAPDIISLAGGLPAGELLPVEAFRECLDAVLRRDGLRALQYSPMHEPLRHGSLPRCAHAASIACRSRCLSPTARSKG